jgi:glutamyl-tRNA synthetase
VFAHVPLIHGPDGAKLSKRHGALGVEAYRAMGYLPEALRNYLVRLGWSHGDDEFFTTEEMIALFDFDGLGKSPARFDFDKLADINSHYLRSAADAVLVAGVKTVLSEADGGAARLKRLDTVGWDRFARALPVLRERATNLIELVDAAAFLLAERPIALDDKAAEILDGDARARLSGLAGRLAGLEAWSTESVEAAVRDFVKTEGLKLGQVGPAIRAALTGTTVSPPIFDMLALLDRDEALGRLRDKSD